MVFKKIIYLNYNKRIDRNNNDIKGIICFN